MRMAKKRGEQGEELLDNRSKCLCSFASLITFGFFPILKVSCGRKKKLAGKLISNFIGSTFPLCFPAPGGGVEGR